MAQRRNESRRQRRLRAVLAPVVAWALRALGASWRVEFRGDDPFVPPEGESERRPFLAALWHEDVIAAATVFRDTGVQVPVSLSRDGSHITAVMRRLGLGDPPRGSSSRSGSAALRGVVRAVRETGLVAMLVDGPRGPARQPKPGIVAAARLSGEPILPVALEARPCLRFGSWDRTKLPLPFARVVVGYGERLSVGRDVSGSDQEVLLGELQQRLVQLGEAGRARLEGRREPPGDPSAPFPVIGSGARQPWSNPMLVIAGTISIDPDEREAAVTAALEMMEATRREDGCISYTFSGDLADPGGFRIFEEWESQEALDAHFKAPHMAKFQAAMGGFGIRDMKVKRYEVASVGSLGG